MSRGWNNGGNYAVPYRSPPLPAMYCDTGAGLSFNNSLSTLLPIEKLYCSNPGFDVMPEFTRVGDDDEADSYIVTMIDYLQTLSDSGQYLVDVEDAHADYDALNTTQPFSEYYDDMVLHAYGDLLKGQFYIHFNVLSATELSYDIKTFMRPASNYDQTVSCNSAYSSLIYKYDNKRVCPDSTGT